MNNATIYEGTKRLMTTPMTRGEYNAYRGLEVPADEDPTDRGYLVEYQDSEKANDPRHAGYISWLPAAVFGRSYKPVSVGMSLGQSKVAATALVTPADIEAEITSYFYFTAAQGAEKAARDNGLYAAGTPEDGKALSLLTFCVLVLRNGFTVTGESACASPENFDAEIGRKIARQNAVAKVWPLLGFRLRDQLSQEREELSVKATKLSAFILDDPAYKELAPAYRYAMNQQYKAQCLYLDALDQRLELVVADNVEA